MAKTASRSTRAKNPRGSGSIKRASAPKASVTRGANAGAHQGGAPRGASRLEPSTMTKGTGRVSGKRQTQKGRGRVSS